MNPMTRTPLALLLLTPLVYAQGTAGLGDQGGWQVLDRVEIVANTDSLTLESLKRKIEEALGELEITTEEQLIQVRNRIVRDQVQKLLMNQAGEDLGFDPALVEARAREIYQKRVEDSGGVSGMMEELKEQDATLTEIREEIRRELYEVTWRRSVLGMDAGSTGRPSEDRFVRPGTKRRVYERMRKTGTNIEFLSDLGAQPPRFELQILFLAGQVYGDLRRAQEKAIEVRQALDEGLVDWDEALDQLGAMQNRGLTGLIGQDAIVRALDPGDGSLLQFVLEGKENDLSPVFPYPLRNSATGEVQVQGFAIYRLLGREPAVIPGFTQDGVQKELTKQLQWVNDNERFMTHMSRLEAAAYVWFPGIEEQKRAQEEVAAEKEREVLEAREENAERARTEMTEEEEEPPPEGDPGGGDEEP